VVSFSGLKDTPSRLMPNKYLKVDSAGTGIEFADVSIGGGAIGFTGLQDTPSTLTAGKYLKVTNDGTGIEFVDIAGGGGGGGSSTFTGLSDTPNTFVGNADKVLIVNSSQNGIEFIDKTGVGILPPSDVDDGAIGQSIIGSSSANTFKKIVQGSNISLASTSVGVTISATFPPTDNSFIGLNDTPSTLSAGKYLRVDGGGTNVVLSDVQADLKQPVGSGFARHQQISTRDSFDFDMPDHIYLRNTTANRTHVFSFCTHDVGNYIEYAPMRSGEFGSYIQFNDNSEGTFKENDAAALGVFNEISLSGYIHQSRAHYEAARNTGVFNQGLRAIVGAGAAELEEELAIEPSLDNIVGTINNWTQLTYIKSGPREAKFIIPPSLTKHYLGGVVILDLMWTSETTAGNVAWEVKVESYAAGDSIDSVKSSSFKQMTSSNPVSPYGLVNERLTFTPSSSEIRSDGMILVTVKRNASAGADTSLGSAGLMFISIIEEI